MKIRRLVIEQLLADWPSVMLQVDTRNPLVDVPVELRGRMDVALQIGWSMMPPINLELDEQGIQARLRFMGSDYLCLIPWSAVYLVHVPGRQFETMTSWPCLSPADAAAEGEQMPTPAPPVRHLKLCD